MNSDSTIGNVEENKSVNYEEKINELESRIAKLEKIERDRKIRRIIYIVIKILIYAGLLFLLYFLFKQLKPYFEQLVDLRNTLGGGSTSDFDLNNFDLNNYFHGLFNW